MHAWRTPDNKSIVRASDSERARATLESAFVDRSFTVLRSPIPGIVASVSTQEGETVAAGLSAPTFVTIIDLDRLQLNAYVDEVDIGKIAPGQSTVFAVDAFPAVRRVLNIPYVHTLLVQSRSSDDLERLEREVRNILRARLAVRPGMTEPFLVQNQAVLLRTERGASRAMSRLTMGAAALAALVGGIGIVAVMLISVRERTREIGLRRALGARRRDIRRQFVMESAILAAVGGTAGVCIGVAAAGAVAILGPWDLVISWRPALLGPIGSTLLGLAVGVIPAARAARLEPIVALRAE